MNFIVNIIFTQEMADVKKKGMTVVYEMSYSVAGRGKGGVSIQGLFIIVLIY